MRRRLPVALLALAISIGAVSCSDDDDTDAASAPTTTTRTNDATTTVVPGSDDPAASTSTTPDESLTTTTATPADPGTTTTAVTAPPVVPGPGTSTSAPGGGSTPPSLPPASIGVPDEPPLNEDGEPITLDETALLACANDQFAWVSFQQGDTAAAGAELAAAAQRAEVSAVRAVSDFADDLAGALDADDPLAVMQSFLDLCVANGFEY